MSVFTTCLKCCCCELGDSPQNNIPKDNEAFEQDALPKVSTNLHHADTGAVTQRQPAGGQLQEEIDADVDLTSYTWYFGNTTRVESELALREPPLVTGKFMVRAANGKEGNVALSFVDDTGKVRHVLFPVQTRKIKELDKNLGRFYDFPSFIAYCQENKWGKLSQLKPCAKAEHEYLKPVDPLEQVSVERSAVKIDFKQKLGAGKFAEVYKGNLLNFPFPVAVKMANRDTVDTSELRKEAIIMAKLKHNNVVQFYAVVAEDPVYIVSEYMPNGSLYSYFRQLIDEDISLEMQLHFCVNVASGMAYLEDKGFIHRDLRADNVLLGHNLVCKIGDFGLARCLDGSVYNSSGSVFPVRWASPEILESLEYSHKSDVWSYGVLLYEIVTKGGKPYKDLKNDAVKRHVIDGKILERPDGCHALLYETMTSCWEFVPEKRPTFSSLREGLQNFQILSVEEEYGEVLEWRA